MSLSLEEIANLEHNTPDHFTLNHQFNLIYRHTKPYISILDNTYTTNSLQLLTHRTNLTNTLPLTTLHQQ